MEDINATLMKVAFEDSEKVVKGTESEIDIVEDALPEDENGSEAGCDEQDSGKALEEEESMDT